MKQWEDWLARCCQQGLNLQPLGHKEAMQANVPQLQRHFVEVSDHAHFQSKLIETRQKSKLFWMVHVAVGWWCCCSVWYTFLWIRKYQNTHSRYTTFLAYSVNGINCSKSLFQNINACFSKNIFDVYWNVTVTFKGLSTKSKLSVDWKPICFSLVFNT